MEIQAEPSSLEGIITKCVNDLRGRYPYLSEDEIARKINVSRSTFNRIKNKKNLPQLDNLIKVVIGSGNFNVLSEAVTHLDEELGSSLRDALSVSLREKDQLLPDDEMERLLDDRDIFIAYLLANANSGVTKERLILVLGNPGLDAIDALVKRDIVSFNGEKYFVKSNTIITRSFESIKRHISTYARFYRTAHVGKGVNYVHSLSEGLNIDGVRKKQDAHRRFHQEIQEIYRDKRNHGDIPSFSVAFCDTLTPVESFLTNENEEDEK